MNELMTDDHTLSLATDYVVAVRRCIANQKARIERLWQVGADTLDAEHTLKVFEDNLRLSEENLEWLKSSG